MSIFARNWQLHFQFWNFMRTVESLHVFDFRPKIQTETMRNAPTNVAVENTNYLFSFWLRSYWLNGVWVFLSFTTVENQDIKYYCHIETWNICLTTRKLRFPSNHNPEYFRVENCENCKKVTMYGKLILEDLKTYRTKSHNFQEMHYVKSFFIE